MSAVKSLESLLRIGTLGSVGDPDVGDGVHVSVSMNPILGWPLHPFVCGVLEPDVVLEVSADFFDRRGRRIATPFAIEDYGEVDVVLNGHSSAWDEPWCWIHVVLDGDDAVVDALDQVGSGRSFARRTFAPYSFGASSIRRLRLSGSGIVHHVMGFPAVYAIEFAERFQWHRPFGLPIDGDALWYAGGQGEGPALDRVAMAAPSRLGPPDEPLGSGTPVTAGDEVARIQGLRDSVWPWIDEAFYGPEVPDQAVMTFTAPPHALVVPHADGVPQKTSSATPCVQALTIQAGDPGLARYLGLATTLPVDPPRGDRPLLVVVGAFFGIHRTRRIGRWRLRDVIPADTHLSDVLANQAAHEFDLAAVQETYRHPREILLLPLVAGVGATPNRPPAPDLSAPPGRWRPRRTGTAESWQQQILLHGAPPAGPVALARLSPGGVTSKHRFCGGRAIALFAGRVPKGTPATTLQVERPSTLADVLVPSDPDGGSWQVVQADRFGRWSDPASVASPLPPRPAPRPPVVQTHVRTAELDKNDTSARNPALLRLSVAVPVAAALEAGALPVSSLLLTIDGVTSTHDTSITSEVVAEVPAPPTFPAQSVDVVVSAVFTDTAGVQSAPAVSAVTVHDPRPLPVVETGPKLLWSGRRDVTGNSELALTWPSAGPDAQYRVYLSSSDRLAPSLGLDLVDGRLPDDPLRATLAGAIWDRRTELRDKADFSLITDPPLTTAGGVVSLRYGIPGSLRGVAFVRVSPLSKGNVEADFASCGLVPVAVPHTERPPAPTVRAVAGDDGSVTVTVEAAGLSAAILARTSPTGAPEVRIRRAQRIVADPVYVSVVGSAALAEDPTRPGTWVATLTDTPAGGLTPYQQVTYWAEVRYPAELALPPGVVGVPAGGGVTTPPGVPAGDVESAWSAASLPATAARVPATVPDIGGLLTFTRDAGGDVISGVLPVTADFTIQLWSEAPTGELAELATVAAEPEFIHAAPALVPPPVRYHALLTDPLRRSGDLIAIEPT
jgi:hypothetical protein